MSHAPHPMTAPGAFPAAEHRARLSRAQAGMAARGLDALLLTTEPEIRYFSGFLTRFWESPTRPWFLVLPAAGDPVAVIPAIGAHLMGQGWITDIRSFASPDPEGAGIALLAETLRGTVPQGGRIGVPSGPETHLRLPLRDWARLQAETGRAFTEDGDLIAALRRIKSPAEIARIETACAIAGRAFARVPDIARPGQTVAAVFRRFQALCLEEGADWVSYLAGGAGPGGYGDVISPAPETPLARGDVLMLDTGAAHLGYFCDYDRNFSLGPPSPEVAAAHARLVEATHAAREAARPGAAHADLHRVMRRILSRGPGAPLDGRLGHGLGMQLTEGPSILPWEETPLSPGMVLTLEPGLELSPGRILVHEENVAVEAGGPARWLSPPADEKITEIPA